MQDYHRIFKPVYEKQNQQKNLNKKTDILTSLNNIKLPLQQSLINSTKCKESQFQSVPMISSLNNDYNNHQCQSARFSNQNQREQVQSFALRSNKMDNTQRYCEQYQNELVDHLNNKLAPKSKFLDNHKIYGPLRARMLDWMVEVMASYNFQHKTYFAGVDIMDRYFASSAQMLFPSQLHIIGVQAMLIATKIEEVYPLKTKTVFQKIVHKKISINELVAMQKTIYQALDFKTTTATFFDIACCQIAINLQRSNTYSNQLIKQMQALCSYLSKLICYDYEMMCQFDKKLIASCLAQLVLQIFQVRNCPRKPKQFSNDQKLKFRLVLIEAIANFTKKFKGLNNLLKFTDKKVLKLADKICCKFI